MQLLDIVLTGALIGGALYLLYRSLWKKSGYCRGCSAENCQRKQPKPTATALEWPSIAETAGNLKPGGHKYDARL
jgi:hypothetical protein